MRGPRVERSTRLRIRRAARDRDSCAVAPRYTNAPPPWFKIDKTVTRNLSEEELNEYEPYFEDAKRLRTLMAELNELTLAMVDPEPAKRASLSSRRIKNS